MPQIAETKLTDPAQTTFNAAPQPTVRDGAGLITNVNTPERQLLAARNAATDAYNIVLTIAASLALAAPARLSPQLDISARAIS